MLQWYFRFCILAENTSSVFDFPSLIAVISQCQVRQDYNDPLRPGLIQVFLGERVRTDAARSLGMS